MAFNPNEYDPSFYLTYTEVSDLLRVSRSTVDKYCRNGLIRKYKLSRNKTLYSKEDVYRMLNLKPNENGVNVIYTRVSNTNQIDKLHEQSNLISMFAIKNGIKIEKTYSDTCKSYTFKSNKRTGLFALLKDITQYKINTIYIMSPDRVTRFGHEIFDEICKFFKVNVVYLSNELTDPYYKNEIRDEVLGIIKSIKQIHNL